MQNICIRTECYRRCCARPYPLFPASAVYTCDSLINACQISGLSSPVARFQQPCHMPPAKAPRHRNRTPTKIGPFVAKFRNDIRRGVNPKVVITARSGFVTRTSVAPVKPQSRLPQTLRVEMGCVVVNIK